MRQRPSTASGIVFMTLEDETDTFNLIVRPHVYEAHQAAARSSAMVVEGKVERQGSVAHVLVSRIRDMSHKLRELSVASRDFR